MEVYTAVGSDGFTVGGSYAVDDGVVVVERPMCHGLCIIGQTDNGQWQGSHQHRQPFPYSL